MSAEHIVYSIQKTYIIKPVSKSEKRILTCDERIDIPTFEELTGVKAVAYSDKFSKIIPCIELKGRFLNEIKLEFETNEGVTVLPVEINPGVTHPLDNPYLNFRYVLVLPRGATGVKSCKIIDKATKKEVQHNFTFGIMPPPYNYDNALFSYISYRAGQNTKNISKLDNSMIIAFRNLQEGLYETQFVDSRFPLTSTPIPEKRNLSMIKFHVTNNTGVKSQMELEFIYRTVEDEMGRDMFALPIAVGGNTVDIDIDKGTITTISDSTAEPFMISFPAKHGNHVITALNKASITGDTTEGLMNYTYYLNPNLKVNG